MALLPTSDFYVVMKPVSASAIMLSNWWDVSLKFVNAVKIGGSYGAKQIGSPTPVHGMRFQSRGKQSCKRQISSQYCNQLDESYSGKNLANIRSFRKGSQYRLQDLINAVASRCNYCSYADVNSKSSDESKVVIGTYPRPQPIRSYQSPKWYCLWQANQD